jgi:DNA repair exonuclease SbcCD ATPase subunit
VRIIALRAENVKRLRAVEITPEGDLVVIAGRNAQGKSSVLDSIWLALAGAAGAKENTRPIRDGEKQASVELDLGDLKVTRRWTEAGSTLHVASADGARYSSPQKMLDGLIGKLTFDPLEFAEASQKDQLATLLSVVELPFDPTELATKRAGVYEARTEVNREIKRLEALLTEIEPTPPDTPDEEVVAAEIASELGALERQHAQADAVRQELHRDEERLVDLERELAQCRVQIEAGAATLAEYADLPDPEMLQQEIDRIDETNARVRAKKERDRVAAALAEARAGADGLTMNLEAIDHAKAHALAEAAMPLDGLSFDDEGVLYQGVPFSQASASERLRASIAIAMALNPQIRVIRITDGSLLDSANLALIEEMAGEHDFQVWIERVDETGEVGITIEDGAVVA